MALSLNSWETPIGSDTHSWVNQLWPKGRSHTVGKSLQGSSFDCGGKGSSQRKRVSNNNFTGDWEGNLNGVYCNTDLEGRLWPNIYRYFEKMYSMAQCLHTRLQVPDATLPIWSWANYLFPLCFSVLTCKVKVVTALTTDLIQVLKGIIHVKHWTVPSIVSTQ